MVESSQQKFLLYLSAYFLIVQLAPMTKIFLSILFVIFFTPTGFAQTKSTTHEQQVWLAYMNQTRLSKKWGIWFDAHLRTKEDFFTNFSSSIIRAGLNY